MTSSELWRFLPLGYLLTVLIETPILVLGLSPRHSLKRRIFAGVWLTACTYPVVVLVLPSFFDDSSRLNYLLVAEIFAPVFECLLFWLAFRKERDGRKESDSPMWRDFGVIVLANLMSFAAGEVLNSYQWFGVFG
jgi:hypothetical protein